jgi:hypothetical protein
MFFPKYFAEHFHRDDSTANTKPWTRKFGLPIETWTGNYGITPRKQAQRRQDSIGIPKARVANPEIADRVKRDSRRRAAYGAIMAPIEYQPKPRVSLIVQTAAFGRERIAWMSFV